MIDQTLVTLLPTLPLIRNPQDITGATRLEQDLRLYGYPARAFIFRYSETYNVDISKFPFYKYFLRDTHSARIHRKIFKRRKNILTMGHLQMAVKYGKLNESVLRDIDSKMPVKGERKHIYFYTDQPHFSTIEKTISVLICIAVALILATVAIIV